MLPRTIGPALTAFGFVDAAFEGVPGAVGIGGGGLGLAEQIAEVEEVLLAGAALGERDGLPFLDELVGRPGRRIRITDSVWLKCNPTSMSGLV